MNPPRRAATAMLALLILAAVAWRWQQHAWPVAAGSIAEASATPVDAPVDGVRNPALRQAREGAGNEAMHRCENAMQATLRAKANELKQRLDVQSQLAYALTFNLTAEEVDLETHTPEQAQAMFKRNQAESLAALKRARALAPGDPDILWLAATHCPASDEDCAELRREMLQAEPDNAAAWLRELTWARMRDDPAGVERALAQAAAARRYDTHGGAGHAALVNAYADVPTPVECASMDAQVVFQRIFGSERPNLAIDWVLPMSFAMSGIHQPAYSDIWRLCKPTAEAPLDDKRRTSCGRILAKLAGGDTLLEQGVALPTLIELAEDGVESAAWRERYRNHRWLMSQISEPEAQRGWHPSDLAFGEVQVMQQALQAAGRWPAPPGWLPDDATSRSLIQNGRPPPPKPLR